MEKVKLSIKMQTGSINISVLCLRKRQSLISDNEKIYLIPTAPKKDIK